MQTVLESVGKRFGSMPALESVSLTSCAGQVAAVVGPNGAGKTTLLGMSPGRGTGTFEH
jgi:ABC-type multidrug transport system ATPase subunit